jgi:hypothetical protein
MLPLVPVASYFEEAKYCKNRPSAGADKPDKKLRQNTAASMSKNLTGY